MPITRINEFHAASGKATALRDFLRSVLEAVATSPGCLDCVLLVEPEDASRLAIVETWDSISAHQAAATKVPADKISEVQALLAEPPKGRYYERLA